MALTNPPLSIPEAVVAVPTRRHLPYGWIAVGLGLLASVAFVVVLLVSSESSSPTAPHSGLAERGSITAIDHGSRAGSPVAQPESLLDRSIVATERTAPGR